MSEIIILCGGRGTRLEPLASHLPKPLASLNGKPILQHIIDFYISKGFHNFVLCTGFNAEAINNFISMHKFEAEIEFSNAGENASILKRIHVARHLIDERAIVTYGDTFINIDPHDVLRKHNESRAEVTITVADIRSPFGLIKFTTDSKVASFEEKPIFSYYIGHMVLERRVLDNLEVDLLSLPDGEGLIKLFQKLIKIKELNAYKHTGLKITFNTFYERQRAEEEFIKFFTEQER